MKHIHPTRNITCLFLACVLISFGFSAKAQSEQQINSSYREMVVNYLRADASNKEQAMNKEAEQILVALPNQDKLYDETFVFLKSEIVNGKDEEGNDELNYVYELSYNCRNIEGTSDDYKEGIYDWRYSNSSKAICKLTKHFIENQCRDYFRQGKLVTIKIFSSTDATEIRKLPYNGEYGDFRYCPAVYNDENVRISVSKAGGITTNAQLAYLRGQSIKNFLENDIPALRNEDVQYEFITKTAANQGSVYRRSSIQITVHKAFDETIQEMTTRLADDDHVDVNIPTNAANSNPSTYVLIIANENYSEPFPRVDYAANDGMIFQNYAVKTLGIPERHVKLINNASAQEIKQDGIDWLKDIAKAQNGNARFIIYYAGLGTTDRAYNQYIIPNLTNTEKIRNFDIKMGSELPLSKRDTKKFLGQAISLDTICNWFNRVQSQGITIILDASFNGYLRNGQPFVDIKHDDGKIRGMRIRNDIVIFSAAEPDKTAYGYDDKRHGFFTYFLLNELRHTKGDIDYETLFNHLTQQMSNESSLQGKLQVPQVIVGGKSKDSWGVKSFK